MKNTSHTFVLIHGAWYGSWAWKKTAKYLRKEEHKVILIDLPNYNNNSEKTITLGDYVNTVYNKIKNITNPILVGHSMAGVILSQFKANYPFYHCTFIYLSAFLIPNEESIKSFILDERKHEENDDINQLKAKKGAVKTFAYYDNKEEFPVFYIDEETLKERFFQNYNIFNGSLSSLKNKFSRFTPFTPISTKLNLKEDSIYFYNDKNMFYINCIEDEAISDKERKRMLEKVKFNKQRVTDISADHSPFFRVPKSLGKVFVEIADKNTKQEPQLINEPTSILSLISRGFYSLVSA
jgi:hypothetical protein